MPCNKIPVCGDDRYMLLEQNRQNKTFSVSFKCALLSMTWHYTVYDRIVWWPLPLTMAAW